MTWGPKKNDGMGNFWDRKKERGIKRRMTNEERKRLDMSREN